jgi:glycosyltransferase involved in cell wall biosynthesis
MRVLFVTREYPPFEVGGVARHTFNLVKHLKELGVECRVVSFGDPAASSRDVSFVRPRSSIISRSDRPIYDDAGIPLDIARFTASVDRLISEVNFDIVHVEEPYVGSFVSHPRKVTTIHDTSYGELRSILRGPASVAGLKRVIFYIYLGFLFERVSAKTSRVIIAPFAHVKEELVSKYGIDRRRIRVIGNGIELPPQSSITKAEAKCELGLPEKPLIFSASQHVARKRLETLVVAARRLKDAGVDCQVVIAGDGPLRGQLEKMAEGYNLLDMVSFPGWVTQDVLDLFYRASDVFVVTSEYEAGPISMLEAMSNGTTVVSSRIDGFASYIRDGVDGMLFPVGDSGALASSLSRALSDKEFLTGSSAMGRSFAERFDWDRIAAQTLSLYEEIA